MTAKKAPHSLVVTSKGDRLEGRCKCGLWVRTTRDDGGGEDRLAGWFVQHVTGGNKL